MWVMLPPMDRFSTIPPNKVERLKRLYALSSKIFLKLEQSTPNLKTSELNNNPFT